MAVVVDPVLETKFKRVGDQLDYGWSVKRWLKPGDVISGVSVDVPAGLTQFKAMTNDDYTITIWLAGGTIGEKYIITADISTAQGRHLISKFYLVIKE